MDQQARDIIVFDGLCVLCSSNAQLVLRHDKDRRFLLASMQGEKGQAIYRQAGMNPEDPESLVVVSRQGLLRNSDAVIYIYRHLGWPWRAASSLALLPRAIRDPLYLLIARNRYRLFGKRQSCWIPDLADRERLL